MPSRTFKVSLTPALLDLLEADDIKAGILTILHSRGHAVDASHIAVRKGALSPQRLATCLRSARTRYAKRRAAHQCIVCRGPAQRSRCTPCARDLSQKRADAKHKKGQAV